MTGILVRLLRPYNIFLLTTVVSFLTWSVPDFDGRLRKGFSEPFMLDPNGAIVSLSWIVIIFISSFVGFRVGMSIKFNSHLLDEKASLYDLRPFKVIFMLALIGVVYVFFQLFTSLGISGIIQAVTGGQANQLKDALYENYSAGLPSLRYLSIPAAALGVFHLMNRRYAVLSSLSLLLLLVVSLISSRLSLVYTIFIFLGLVARERNIRIKAWQAILGLIVVVHLIFALNYSRNINFYRSMGVDNFYMAGISETVTYVGSPFQGFLAASSRPGQLSNMSEQGTHTYTGISQELSTNSALLELVREDDIYTAFLRITWSVLVSSFIMALAWRNRKNILLLTFGALGYCFAEIWRINLFSQGIVATIVLSIAFISLLCVFSPKLSVSRKHLRRYSKLAKTGGRSL